MEINYERRGSGTPLVLLHGIGHRWQAWEPVLDRLALHHDVIAVDLPGFGLSPSLPEPYSVDAATTYAGQLAAHNAAAQHNVDVMEAYESASAFNAKGQPQSYGTIEPDNGTIVVRQPPTAVTVEKLEPVRPNVSRKTDTHQDPHWTDTDGKVTDNRGGYDVGGSGDDAVANRGGRELGHTVTSGVPDTPEIPVDPVDGSRV
ncbi:alpha/beta fold hydrolase, partial [Kibdelosporangium lantanae]